MPLPRILRLFAAAGVQTIALQVLGVVFFYALSRFVSKEAFGLLGWCTATAFLIITAAGAGLEQVVLRHISAARARSADWVVTTLFVHNVATTVLLGLGLLLLRGLFPGHPRLAILPLVFGAQAFSACVLPARLWLTAQQSFAPFALVGLVSNGAKLAAAIWLGSTGRLGLGETAYILFAGGALELISAAIVARMYTQIRPQFKLRAYKLLLREARPQYLSVLFDTGLARLDWILLGALVSDMVVAEYSFAYRGFELERLPTAVVGAVVLPLAARWLARGAALSEEARRSLGHLLLGITAMAGWAAVVAVAVWAPAVDAITAGAYGKSSVKSFGLLNIALPLQFVINLLWTQTFAAQRFRSIARITVAAALVNVGANLVLIPLWHAAGAAAAFALSSGVQAALYAQLARKSGFWVPVRRLAGIVLTAAALIATVLLAAWFDWRGLLLGLVGFPALATLTGAVSRAEVRSALLHLKR